MEEPTIQITEETANPTNKEVSFLNFEESIFLKVLAFIVFSLFIYLILRIFSNYFLIYDVPTDKGELGTLGDYIGGILNPVFAFVSFMALLYTIYLQRREMALSRKELNDTRKVMNEQLKTQSLQQFDSLFFPMLNELNTILDKLESSNDLLNCSYDNVFNECISMEEAWQRILRNKSLSRYFIFLYQLLKIISIRIEENNYIDKNSKIILKKTYSNIVRASIPEQLMQLLMINAVWGKFGSYRELLEEFNFLEHVSFKRSKEYLFLLFHCIPKYDKEAFGNSSYIEEINSSNIFYKYVLLNILYKYDDFFKSIFVQLDSNSSLQRRQEENKDSIIKNEFLLCSIQMTSGIIEIYLNKITCKPEKWYFWKTGLLHAAVKWNCNLKLNVNNLVIFKAHTDERLLEITSDENGKIQYEVTPKEIYNQ